MTFRHYLYNEGMTLKPEYYFFRIVYFVTLVNAKGEKLVKKLIISNK